MESQVTPGTCGIWHTQRVFLGMRPRTTLKRTVLDDMAAKAAVARLLLSVEGFASPAPVPSRVNPAELAVNEGSIGLLEHVDSGIVSPIYIVFRTDPHKVFAPYLYALFKTETYRHIFAMATNASVDRRGSLRWKEFSSIRVPLPSLDEQKRMVVS